MQRRFASAVVAAVLATCPWTPTAAPAHAREFRYPSSMAALGDSISRGFNACGWFFDCTARSWATGDSERVDGHYRRLVALDRDMEGNRYNDAQDGAGSAELVAQAASAVDQRVQYVTILIGGADACAATEEAMTSVDQYRVNFAAALSALKEGLPKSKVFIASVPDLYRVWELGKDDPDARNAWALIGACPSMFADPLSTDPAAVQRRANVSRRITDYNTAAAELCSAYGTRCAHDGGAVHNTPFTRDDISTWDFFHPSAAGQARIAEVTFAAVFGTVPSPAQ